MASYFSNLGNVWHRLPTGERILINDITKFVNILQSYKADPRYYIQDNVKPEVRPEVYSYRLYGTVDYWWTIYVLNDIYDISSSWPRTQVQLEEYMREKYHGVDPTTHVLHYLNADGLKANILDFRVKYNLFAESDEEILAKFDLEPVTVREYENEINEAKRLKKFIAPDQIGRIQKRFEQLLK